MITRERASGRRGEAGSAYVVALLVLVVLTIIGLALTLVTQSEVQVGAYERTTSRSFYASDSGVSVGTSATMWQSNDKNLTFLVNTTKQDTGASPLTTFADEVTVSPLTQIQWQNCHLCEINSDNPLKLVIHVAQSSVQRIGLDSSGTSVANSQKGVATMIALQPWTPNVNRELSGATKAAFGALNKVHF
jgi:Tfp pilus assembly protein PilX